MKMINKNTFYTGGIVFSASLQIVLYEMDQLSFNRQPVYAASYFMCFPKKISICAG